MKRQRVYVVEFLHGGEWLATVECDDRLGRAKRACRDQQREYPEWPHRVVAYERVSDRPFLVTGSKETSDESEAVSCAE